MLGSTFASLSLDELAQQAASQSALQSSHPAYLLSVALVAAVIIGVFFGVGFSLLIPEQIIGNAGACDSRTEAEPPDSIASPRLSKEALSVPIEAELALAAAPARLPVASFAQDLAV